MLQRFLVSVSIALAIVAPAAARRMARTAAIQPAPPASSPCLEFYLDGQPPSGMDPAPGDQRRFCHSFYVTDYGTTRRDPVWTSYHLTAAMVLASDGFKRKGRTFAPQDGLEADLQGRDDDFENPPFDRGHMTPDNDAPTRAMQADTYVVTNIVPQVSGFNEGLWAGLEKAVHKLAKSEGDVYVVTGPIFAEPRPPMHGIAVPSSLFKAIYVPSRSIALAIISTNTMPTTCRIVAVAVVQQETGIDPFPSLPASAKASLPAIPRGWPKFPRRCRA